MLHQESLTLEPAVPHTWIMSILSFTSYIYSVPPRIYRGQCGRQCRLSK
jgi:hypothetical protein